MFIAGPSFDAYSDICVQYLNRILSDANVTFSLLRANKDGSRFDIPVEDPLQWLHSNKLAKGKFYLSPGTFVYYVLSTGANPVLWKIGRQRNGKLDPLKGNAGQHVLVRRHVFTSIDPPKEVSTERTGTTWKSKSGHFTAIVIGVVDRGGRGGSAKARVGVAKYKSKTVKFTNFSVRPLKCFLEMYRPAKVRPPDWPEIAAASESV